MDARMCHRIHMITQFFSLLIFVYHVFDQVRPPSRPPCNPPSSPLRCLPSTLLLPLRFCRRCSPRKCRCRPQLGSLRRCPCLSPPGVLILTPPCTPPSCLHLSPRCLCPLECPCRCPLLCRCHSRRQFLRVSHRSLPRSRCHSPPTSLPSAAAVKAPSSTNGRPSCGLRAKARAGASAILTVRVGEFMHLHAHTYIYTHTYTRE